MNVAGEAIPLLVSLVAAPLVIAGLGVERFGILSLTWVIIFGYFSLFDFGLGRATTRYVARELERSEEHTVAKLVWTSLLLQGGLGICGGFLLAGLTPWMTTRLLHVRPEFIHQTQHCLFWLSLGVPFVICSAGLRGLLEAKLRFDLVNTVKVPTNCALSLAPVFGIHLGFDLSRIVALQVIITMASTVVLLVLVLGLLPYLKTIMQFDRRVLGQLAGYMGWMTVLMLTASLVTSLERFLIGMRLSMSDVGYYTPPATIITRLMIIPSGIVMVLFPRFSAMTVGDYQQIQRLFHRAFLLLLWGVGPLAILLMVFAKNVLEFWLGVEFASHSSAVLRILALGFFLNALGWVPSIMLQGFGRPDVVAKLFLCELPLYAALGWWLIGVWGIEGAAIAWTLRAGCEAVLQLWLVRKMGVLPVAA
ncbi:MAG: flippase [Candidatus Omnitrophica bacterium]|nr:flippase [Candidatus Omnitrophota bacterium]